MKFDLRIKKLRDNAQMPTYGSEWAAGADIYGKALPPSLPADVIHKIPFEHAISDPTVMTHVSPSKSE